MTMHPRGGQSRPIILRTLEPTLFRPSPKCIDKLSNLRDGDAEKIMKIYLSLAISNKNKTAPIHYTNNGAGVINKKYKCGETVERENSLRLPYFLWWKMPEELH